MGRGGRQSTLAPPGCCFSSRKGTTSLGGSAGGFHTPKTRAPRGAPSSATATICASGTPVSSARCRCGEAMVAEQPTKEGAPP